SSGAPEGAARAAATSSFRIRGPSRAKLDDVAECQVRVRPHDRRDRAGPTAPRAGPLPAARHRVQPGDPGGPGPRRDPLGLPGDCCQAPAGTVLPGLLARPARALAPGGPNPGAPAPGEPGPPGRAP